MSRWNDCRGKGAAKANRADKRAEAIERQRLSAEASRIRRAYSLVEGASAGITPTELADCWNMSVWQATNILIDWLNTPDVYQQKKLELIRAGYVMGVR